MTARDNLLALIHRHAAGVGPLVTPQDLDDAINAVRAEALNDAADLIDSVSNCRCGGCDTCVVQGHADNLRAVAKETTSG